MIKWEEESYARYVGYVEIKICGIPFWDERYRIYSHLKHSDFSEITIWKINNDKKKKITNYDTNIHFNDGIGTFVKYKENIEKYMIGAKKIPNNIERKRKIKKFFNND